jgi:competence CoiA-like predicted nuclease
MTIFSNKRTIEFVLNKIDGSTVYADSFFLKEEYVVFNYRNELQKAIKGIREPLFGCYFCGQNIKINGGGQTKKVLHFAHRKDNSYCKLKTDTELTKLEINRVKYNGAKESPLHFETKHLIKQFITFNNDFSNIKDEVVVKSNTNYLEWKRPDISAIYKNDKVVFEIQLSTTFLSVIVDREHFYKENQTYILWVFKNFEVDEFKQRFTEKDVFYSNNRNAFVLDNEAINLSQKNNDLYLLCYYQKPKIENLKIDYDWCFEYVNFNHLTFDEINYKIFYFDVSKEEQKLNNEILATQKEIRGKELAKQQKAKEDALKFQKERKKNIEDDYEDYNYLYYEDEIKVPELTISQKLIRDKNIAFDESNSSFLIELRNEFLITNYQRLFLKQQDEMYDKIFEFFKNDYAFANEDKSFIKKVFNESILNTEKLNDSTIIYYVSISIFFNRLSNNKELYNVYNSKVQQLLFAILSIKMKRVIGNNFSNLIQVVNQYTNLKSDRVVFFDVIVRAIEVYYGIDEFCKSEDKKALLKPKILNTNNWKPQQETKYNEIVTIVFPEIIFTNEDR